MRIVGLRHAKKGSTIVEAWEIIGLNFRCRRPAELSEEPPMTSALPFRSQQLGHMPCSEEAKHAVAADV